MTNHNGFDPLHSHAQRLKGARIPDLLAAEPGRVQELALRVGPLYVNFARQKYDAEALRALLALAGQHDVGGAIQRLFRGEQVNPTEGRAALHTALRGNCVDVRSPPRRMRSPHRCASAWVNSCARWRTAR